MSARTTPRYLVVRAQSTALRLALPELGALSIGRSATSDVRIRENGVESEHAVIYLDHGLGVRALAEDVARIEMRPGKPPRERFLEVGKTVELEVGDRLRIGSAELIFTSSPEVKWAPRAVPRSFFDARLEAELDSGDRPRLAVSRFKVSTPFAVGEPEASLEGILRPGDVLTRLGDTECAVLLREVTEALARSLTSSIAEGLRTRGGEVLAGLALGGDVPPSRLLDLTAERLTRPSLAGDRPRTLLAQDPAMQKVARLVERVAKSTAPVLILGDTGVGKDLIAQMIHERGERAGGPFVRVSCVDLSDAFEGDAGVRVLARARGGTLHLDEIAGLSPRAQLSLGHLLDAAPSAMHDVRFIASSNQDLNAAVSAGAFRKDLFFRLNPLTVHVPSLRERAGDIIPLAELFLEESARKGASPPKLSARTKAALLAYGWPGNVRELRNAMERALLLCAGDTLGPEHLPTEISGGTSVDAAPEPTEVAGGADKPRSLREEIEALEKKRILEALQRYPTQRDAAAALDMPMRTFLNRLDQFGIPRARGGGGGSKGE